MSKHSSSDRNSGDDGNAVVSDSDRKKLLDHVASLDDTERMILCLLSAAYEDVATSTFLKCVNACGLKNGTIKFDRGSLDSLLLSFCKAGFAERIDDRSRISRKISEPLTRMLASEGTLERIAEILNDNLPGSANNTYGYDGIRFRNIDHVLRFLRLTLYTDTPSEFLTVLYYALQFCPDEFDSVTVMFRSIWWNPYEPQWLENISPQIRDAVLKAIFADANVAGNKRPAEALKLMKRLVFEHAGETSSSIMQMYGWHLLETGQLAELHRLAVDFMPLAKKGGAFYSLLFQGVINVLQGKDQDALSLFDLALAQKKKDLNKRKVWFETELGAFYFLAILRLNDHEKLREAKNTLSEMFRKKNHFINAVFLSFVFDQKLGDNESAKGIARYAQVFAAQSYGPFVLLIGLHAIYWVNGSLAGLMEDLLQSEAKKAWNSGLEWVAAEATILLERTGAEISKNDLAKAEEYFARTKTQPLADIITRQEPWEAALDEMARFVEAPQPQRSTETLNDSRLVWLLSYEEEEFEFGDMLVNIEPIEQKRNKNGWSKGRKVSLKRLATERESIACLAPEDVPVCEAIKAHGTSGYYGSVNYNFNIPKALKALVGHPRLFMEESPDTPLELVEGEPQLRVEETKNELLIRIEPFIHEHLDVMIQRNSPTSLCVYFPGEEYKRLASMVGGNGLRVPLSAREKVLQAISAVSSVVTVHSDIGGGKSAKEVKPDNHLYAHILPLGEGIRVELLVKPLGSCGPAHSPGEGGDIMVAEVEGERLQTRRDFSVESDSAEKLLERCPAFSVNQSGRWQWMFDNPLEALEALSQLRDCEDFVELDWPRGGKVRVTPSVSFDRLSQHIDKGNNWLSVKGDLQIDEERVVSLAKLLELLDGTTGRFVKLGDGEYIALTEALRRQLEEFRAVGESSEEEIRLHPLMAARVDALAQDSGSLKESAQWKREREKLRQAYDMPLEVPSTLQAELREYQHEGFCWMARLAHWGAGACLADDMGLGKTVQALALLLHRAAQGPALVIAPTSVCGNWAEEACKFAPVLQVHNFGSSDRQELIEQAGAFDLIICSYGLLQQEADLFDERQWTTVILDEAHSIKNATTQRSKAAMRLQAGFRAILTGTPIENHLGELWNLFRFINPGLLGSQERFQQIFATPIEKNRDSEARAKLRGLLQPFLLRRTKAQVLQELPERTEITIRVEPSVEERDFYEALRRRCVEDVQTQSAPEGSRFKILAAIMKLRRACCHPALVQPDLALSSAKHEAFDELLDEILENRHKALVFSQFVDHLSILRNRLEKRKVSYQYLDGSTPQKERDKRVKAFQSGEGDIFLISLKAGGTGLNLTAADYVIHMDPWWNPAVEDQATDRAHRIGQTRPVTIYRIVAQNTIEEKIVELHRDKRDLADSLLEGTESGARLSADDLLRLLHEG